MAGFKWAQRAAEADAWLLAYCKGDKVTFDRAIHAMGQYHQKGGRQDISNYGFTLIRYVRSEAKEKQRKQRERIRQGKLSLADRVALLEAARGVDLTTNVSTGTEEP